MAAEVPTVPMSTQVGSIYGSCYLDLHILGKIHLLGYVKSLPTCGNDSTFSAYKDVRNDNGN
jgi:hypothetical protein